MKFKREDCRVDTYSDLAPDQTDRLIAVRITHIPTGKVVTVQGKRPQPRLEKRAMNELAKMVV